MRAAMRSTRPLCCVSARVLRAYIYNALFTTAKPPKIRLSLSLSLLLTHSLSFFLSLFPPSLPLRGPGPALPPPVTHTSRAFVPLAPSLFPFVPFSCRRHGFFYTSVVVDRHTALCPPSSHFLFLLSLLLGPSSHLRVPALTSRLSFVPVIDTRSNEREMIEFKRDSSKDVIFYAMCYTRRMI